MSSRFGQRGPNLFSAYDANQAATLRTQSQSPSKNASARANRSSPYGASSSSPYSLSNTDVRHTNTSSAYPAGGGGARPPSSGDSGLPWNEGAAGAAGLGGYRSATPNKKGQYSDAVLNELESQNDEQLEGMSAKVKMLKDITTAIGAEIRDSTTFAESMNDSFEGTRVKLRGTMNRMLRMAEKTGVGWRVWLGFFAAVIILFWYVWLG